MTKVLFHLAIFHNMKAAFKRNFSSSVNILLPLALALLLSGCAAQPTPTAPRSSGSSSVFEPDVSPPSTNEEGGSTVTVKAAEFAGEIFLDAATITPESGGFSLPVFLRNVTTEDAVDTVTLKAILPDGVRLRQVVAPTGFTAQLDGIETQAPVIYFHNLSLTPDSYSPVVASDAPIFTLVFTGEPNGKIAAEASFFRADAILIRTNRGVLQL